MKAMIDDLVAVHSGAGVYAVNAALGAVAVPESAKAIGGVETEHPLVCRAPETGRPYLFVSGVMRRFRGMTEAESRPLIAFLQEHMRSSPSSPAASRGRTAPWECGATTA